MTSHVQPHHAPRDGSDDGDDGDACVKRICHDDKAKERLQRAGRLLQAKMGGKGDEEDAAAALAAWRRRRGGGGGGVGAAVAAAAAGGGGGGEEREEEEGYSECPPDRLQYGRHTWTFLHSTGAYFPAQPSEEDKASMRGILSGVGRLFACGHCAQHMRKYMAAHPPDVSGTVGLSTWLCHMHNDVNRRLGKPIFDCSKVLERWRDGPADGSCE